MAFASGETRWCAKPHETSSLTGRTYLVTGGTGTGLGAHTALHLALRGATVLVGSRTESTALAHIASLENVHPDIVGRLRFFRVDLASFQSAREAGERVLGMTNELHGVVNNAGRLATAGPFTLSPEGIEMLAAVNHFGTFIFTETLLPLLIKTSKAPGADVRIVNVGSFAQQYVPKDAKLLVSVSSFNDTFAPDAASINSINAKMARYGLSKLYNHLHISELQRRLDAEEVSITCIAVSPGGVGTDNALDFSSISPILNVLRPVMKLITLTPSQGAYSSLFAVASPIVAATPEKYRGKTVVPFGQVKSLSAFSDDVGLQKKLWQLTEEVIEAGGIHGAAAA